MQIPTEIKGKNIVVTFVISSKLWALRVTHTHTQILFAPKIVEKLNATLTKKKSSENKRKWHNCNATLNLLIFSSK